MMTYHKIESVKKITKKNQVQVRFSKGIWLDLPPTQVIPVAFLEWFLMVPDFLNCHPGGDEPASWQRGNISK